jgi:hypothetical protein
MVVQKLPIQESGNCENTPTEADERKMESRLIATTRIQKMLLLRFRGEMNRLRMPQFEEHSNSASSLLRGWRHFAKYKPPTVHSGKATRNKPIELQRAVPCESPRCETELAVRANNDP